MVRPSALTLLRPREKHFMSNRASATTSKAVAVISGAGGIQGWVLLRLSLWHRGETTKQQLA